MTHDELLAKINETSPADKYDASWQSALRAVVELHGELGGDCDECWSEDGYIQYPCPTIQAIEKELG